MLASPEAVAVFRSTHSVPETAARFGINERTVYKLVAKARRAGDVGRLPVAPVHPQIEVKQDTSKHVGSEHRTSSPDDVAGDDTEWLCPSYGYLVPVVPGVRRADWEAQRRRLKAERMQARQELADNLAAKKAAARPVPAPAVSVPAPAPTPGQDGLVCAPAPAPAPAVVAPMAPARPAPVPVVVVKCYSVTHTSVLDQAVTSWLAQSVHVWGPLLVGLLLCLVAFRGW